MREGVRGKNRAGIEASRRSVVNGVKGAGGKAIYVASMIEKSLSKVDVGDQCFRRYGGSQSSVLVLRFLCHRGGDG